ncbi:uncharacterized protein [Cebidichthys violaceus]|uniref:uncharacterized protein n=1 Tax=Cebidichthys violaceus TaxID=271503 RepID=UPI0035C9E214
MASQKTLSGQTKEAPLKTMEALLKSMEGPLKPNEAPLKTGGLPGHMLRGNTLMGRRSYSFITAEAKPHKAASIEQNPRPWGTRKQCLNFSSGNGPENSIIVREALRMFLPHHLVLRNVRRRVKTHGANYTDMKELVTDLFAADDGGSEVPMETNQLEEALMMSSPVVTKALQMGAPSHLIKPKVRAKIMSNRVGYADVSELLTDLNMMQKLLTHT